ncbi:MAG: hypothetical protein OXC10_06310 [Rhodospirillaceae bacterium]|nr:hypothetical protein [Rhodospirillaceae bacterium]
MSKYGNVAILAAKRARSGQEPASAWKQSAEEIFRGKPESQKKGCPRNAFLGLAEEGLIRGVASGKYTNSKDNKRYALEGLKFLNKCPEAAEYPKMMWDKIMDGKIKSHNEQMFVVAALWKNGDIEK